MCVLIKKLQCWIYSRNRWCVCYEAILFIQKKIIFTSHVKRNWWTASRKLYGWFWNKNQSKFKQNETKQFFSRWEQEKEPTENKRMRYQLRILMLLSSGKFEGFSGKRHEFWGHSQFFMFFFSVWNIMWVFFHIYTLIAVVVVDFVYYKTQNTWQSQRNMWPL